MHHFLSQMIFFFNLIRLDDLEMSFKKVMSVVLSIVFFISAVFLLILLDFTYQYLLLRDVIFVKQFIYVPFCHYIFDYNFRSTGPILKKSFQFIVKSGIICKSRINQKMNKCGFKMKIDGRRWKIVWVFMEVAEIFFSIRQ